MTSAVGQTVDPGATRASRWALAGLVILSGLLTGFAAPAHPVSWAWPFLFAPMFLALDVALKRVARPGRLQWRRWGRVLACTLPVGMLLGGVSGDWVEQAAFVFGGLPRPLSFACAWLGYGGLLGLEVFLFLGVPFTLARDEPLRQLALVTLWPTVLQAWLPRFLFWSYGQLMFPAAWLIQIADVTGSVGLNLWVLPLHWLLYAAIRRRYEPGWLRPRELAVLAGAVAVLFAASAAYGHWRLEKVAAAQAQGERVRLVGIQPDFSFRRFASHPERLRSSRPASVQALIDDSEEALPPPDGVRTILVWPESAYPGLYFRDQQVRAAVEHWARVRNIDLVLVSIDTRDAAPAGEDRPRAYGAAIHVSPTHEPEVYHKLTPIPFGETVPFGDVFPAWRRLYLATIRNTSDFGRGREFTVFDVSPGVRLAPLICFDAFDAGPAQGMAANGATLGLVLANLTWFGDSTASRQMEHFVRLRAIENRIPFFIVSQNGESVLIDARGEAASRRLPLFEADALTVEVHTGPGSTFFTRHAKRIYAAYAIALAAVLLRPWTWRRRPDQSRSR